jgi:hypothetical protein
VLIRPLVPAPAGFGFAAGALLVGIAILLVAIRPATATRVAGAPLLLGAVWILLAALWNERHHGEVAGAIDAQRRARRASLRRHPVLWATVLPLAAAGRAVARLETGGTHHGLALLLAIGLGTWALCLGAVVFGLRRARTRPD